MPISVECTAMVGGYNHQPFLVKVLLAVFYGIPYSFQLSVGIHHSLVGELTVATLMESIVGVPHIHPVKVGRILLYAFCCLFAHVSVDVADM